MRISGCRALRAPRPLAEAISTAGGVRLEALEPRMLLVHFIRETLGLTGTHWGCDTSNCGVCVAWLDGEPVKSCTVLAAMAATLQERLLPKLAEGGMVFLFAPDTDWLSRDRWVAGGAS